MSCLRSQRPRFFCPSTCFVSVTNHQFVFFLRSQGLCGHIFFVNFLRKSTHFCETFIRGTIVILCVQKGATISKRIFTFPSSVKYSVVSTVMTIHKYSYNILAEAAAVHSSPVSRGTVPEKQVPKYSQSI